MNNKVYFYKSKFFYNIILTIIFIFLLFIYPSIQTRYSGMYTLIEYVNYLFNYYFKAPIFTNLSAIFIVLYLGICCLFNDLNKVTKVLSILGYIGILFVEFIFALVIHETTGTISVKYVLLCFYTLGWVIFLFVKKDKVGEEMPKNTTTNTVNNVVVNNKNYLDEIKQLKELLDMDAITKEEFETMKKDIIERNK